MTDIRFFHDAPEKLAAACRITAVAHRKGRRVTVLAPDRGTAQRFDELLWTFQPLAFVPHVAANSPLAAETPVLIAAELDAALPADVLVNLSDEVPEGFERFNEVVEIVSQDPADRQFARSRVADYKRRGLQVSMQPLGSPNAAAHES
jgi:DNA polymerase-3 subunit chi